jgi:hypothetical protein
MRELFLALTFLLCFVNISCSAIQDSERDKNSLRTTPDYPINNNSSAIRNSERDKNSPQTMPDYPINNIGNTNNYGGHFIDNNILYSRVRTEPYSSAGYAYLAKQELTSTDVTALDSSTDAGNIVVYGNYVYYRDVYWNNPYANSLLKGNDSGSIYRINIETGIKERVTEELVSCFYIYNDNIYFQVGDYDGGNAFGKVHTNYRSRLMKTSLDGKQCETIYASKQGESITSLFCIYKNELFFIINYTEITILSLATNESRTISLSDYNQDIINAMMLAPIEDSIYFAGVTAVTESVTTFYLYKFDIVRPAVSKVIDERIKIFTTDYKQLYICTDNDIVTVNIADNVIEHHAYDTTFPLYTSAEILNDKLYLYDEYRHEYDVYDISDN